MWFVDDQHADLHMWKSYLGICGDCFQGACMLDEGVIVL